jgi:hypothetical protein
MKETKKLWWGLVLLILISPLGLILPEVFKSGSAWGEWHLEEIGKMLGFIPEGIKRLSNLWPAPVHNYNVKTWEGQGLAKSSLAYILSGALGVGVIVLVSFFLGKILTKKNKT